VSGSQANLLAADVVVVVVISMSLPLEMEPQMIERKQIR